MLGRRVKATAMTESFEIIVVEVTTKKSGERGGQLAPGFSHQEKRHGKITDPLIDRSHGEFRWEKETFSTKKLRCPDLAFAVAEV